jgi:hypothetical protein
MGSYSVIGTDGLAPGTLYDTPSLYIVNTGSHSLTGLSLTATGYQGLNNGISQAISIPNVKALSTL